jgi:hypothetical protein
MAGFFFKENIRLAALIPARMNGLGDSGWHSVISSVGMKDAS